MKPIKIRVRSLEHSEMIQKMLFAVGCRWMCSKKRVQLTEKSILCVSQEGKITWRDDHDPREEVSFDWLLPPVETVFFNGKAYNKADVEKALALLTPVEED